MTLKEMSHKEANQGRLNLFVDAVIELGLNDFDTELSAETIKAIYQSSAYDV